MNTGKKPAPSSPYYKKKTPRTKTLEKRIKDAIKDKGANAAPQRSHMQVFEVIATAAQGLKLRTQTKAMLRKEADIRRERNIVAKDAREVLSKAKQAMLNERDPDLKAEASKRVETALRLQIPKEEEAAQQVARVKNLKQQCEELIAAVAEMVVAAGGVLPYINASEVDNDILQAGLTAQAKFNAFCAEFESRPMEL